MPNNGGLARDYHFIFIDIVGFSKPSNTATTQVQKISFINKIIRGSKTVKETSWRKLIRLPTGDGMALGFADSAEQPLQLAIEIHDKLKKYNVNKPKEKRLDVRIGLHTGGVYKVIDINGKENICGPGIIIAR